MPSFVELRRDFPRLKFSQILAQMIGNDLCLQFEFELEAVKPELSRKFRPQLVIHQVPIATTEWLKTPRAQQYFLNLGLIELVSYWKATCSPEVVIAAGWLDSAALEWWRETWLQGLGEFFFQNQIDPSQTDLLRFRVSAEAQNCQSGPSPEKPTASEKILVPVGGGKDSSAMLGWLAEIHQPFGAFLLEPHSPGGRAVINLSQASETLTATRTLDPQLLELNRAGFLNGHTPFSAYLGWVSVMVAEIFGYSQVVVANEQSANEANTTFHGQVINHQYSKTTGYEARFRDYLARQITPKTELSHSHDQTPSYFSLWRPLHELQIAKIFSHYPQFFPMFRSCNLGQQQNVWCHQCAKCVFVYTLLAPFLPAKTLQQQIFDHDLFADVALVPLWKQLLGFEAHKPFECVGTQAEVLSALAAVIQNYLGSEFQKAPPDLKTNLPAALAALWQETAIRQALITAIPINQFLGEWINPHFLPEYLELKLRQTIAELAQNQTQPSPKLLKAWRQHPAVWKLRGQKLAILGLGREGWATYQWLRQVLPTQPLVLGDVKPLSQLASHWQTALAADPLANFWGGPRFLELVCQPTQNPANRPDYLLVTPGLRTDQSAIQAALAAGSQLHSQTQLFFELCPGKIIGVTGTKGKSTTSSLIYHVLIENSLPAVLVGNIGTPALSRLGEITPQTWVVMELSCHQLQHLTLSPHIAVIQNITSEHLDYYPNTAAYVTAKSAIAKWQTADDRVIFAPELATPSAMAALGKAKPLTFRVTNRAGAATHPSATPESPRVWLADDQFWLAKAATPLEGQAVIAIKDLPLLGHHNLYNVAPAIIVGAELGLSPFQIAAAIKTFQTLPHRLQKVAEIADVIYYDDSLSTTPEATMAGLQSFQGQWLILLAGGYERHQDFGELAGVILKTQVRAVVLFPTTGIRLWQAIKTAWKNLEPYAAKLGMALPAHAEVATMTEAIAAARKFLPESKTNPQKSTGEAKIATKIKNQKAVVLLSPASASFNTFKDYHDRGLKFQEAVTI